MMGKDKPYDDVARMYFIIHADHESGNVSAHTGHLVGSALSDVYYATSAMINAIGRAITWFSKSRSIALGYKD